MDVLLVFFYSYLIITDFVLMNVIVGFICDFIGMYQGNCEDIQLEQEEIIRNQTMIDLFLDKERKDGETRSDVGNNDAPPNEDEKDKEDENKEK